MLTEVLTPRAPVGQRTRLFPVPSALSVSRSTTGPGSFCDAPRCRPGDERARIRVACLCGTRNPKAYQGYGKQRLHSSSAPHERAGATRELRTSSLTRRSMRLLGSHLLMAVVFRIRHFHRANGHLPRNAADGLI